MIKSIILGFICFLAFLVMHALVFRIMRPKERFRALVYIFLSLVPVYLLLYLLTPSGYLVLAPLESTGELRIPLELTYKLTYAINFLSGLVLYAFLFLGYCQFYFIVDRSISVRVMIEIEGSPERKMTFEEISGAYPYKELMERRLEHMLNGKYLVSNGDAYKATGKGRLEARFFKFLKDFLMIGKGG